MTFNQADLSQLKGLFGAGLERPRESLRNGPTPVCTSAISTLAIRPPSGRSSPRRWPPKSTIAVVLAATAWRYRAMEQGRLPASVAASAYISERSLTFARTTCRRAPTPQRDRSHKHELWRDSKRNRRHHLPCCNSLARLIRASPIVRIISP
jgi:hypothetical protein